MENTTAGEAPVIEFNAKALAPVAVFKAETDIRYYLNGICVQPNKNGPGCFIVGCDGHRLAVWHDPAGVCSQLTVLRVDKALLSACRKKYKGQQIGLISLEDGRLVLKSSHGLEMFVQAGKAAIELADRRPDGSVRQTHHYPDVWRVIPPAKDLAQGMMGAFNPMYMEDIGKVGKMFRLDSWSSGVYHFHNKHNIESGPCVTRFDKEPNFVVLTMRMRADRDITKNPLPDAFVAQSHEDKSTAMATASNPCGSMGEEVAP